MKAAKKHKTGTRLLIAGAVFTLAFVVICGRAAQLQLQQGEQLSRKAARQYERSIAAQGRRGMILDRNLAKMAVSIDVASVGAHPALVKDVPKTADFLASVLEKGRKPLVEKLSSSSPFVWIERHVSPKQAEAARSGKLPGIVLKTERSRFYPHKHSAAQLIGFAGIDGRGLEGLEFYYDRYLKGPRKESTIILDAMGRGFSGHDDPSEKIGGLNLVLTIDRRIQFISETALSEAVEAYDGKSGIAIVMEPKTGAVLAMAHYPFFNPNSFTGALKSHWRNRAITDPFEPGSTMKIFSAAAALQSKASGPNTIFYCENGSYRIGSNTVHDTHAYQWLSLSQIVKLSSNIGAVKIGETMGKENLYRTLRDFGFGEKTGFDCPGETSGMLTHFRRWYTIDAATIAFGQGVSVSALQLITAVSAIANDGILMKPYVVEAITDSEGAVVKKFGPQRVRRAISGQNARILQKIMATVTEEGGTGTHAAIEGYSVAGKTGTAQKIGENGTYAKGRFVASFVGFVPTDSPRVAVLVVIDEPRKAHYGGIVSAPVFKKIASQALHYMNIVPGEDKERLTARARGETRG